MASYSREEIDATVKRYLAVRDEINAGKGYWERMAEFFTEDAVFIDPAWGRVEGRDEMLRTVLGEAMEGLDDWTFPTDCYAIVDDTVIVKWRQRFPGKDGKVYEQSGYSTLVYAGDGRFCYEEDLLNMAHVIEDLQASGWRPPDGKSMHLPPANPNRDFSRPAGR